MTEKAPVVFATTRYNQWSSQARSNLFATLQFTSINAPLLYQGQLPKIPAASIATAFGKIFAGQKSSIEIISSRRRTPYVIFYQEATRYWIKVTVGLPYYAKNELVGVPAHGRVLYFKNELTAHVACAILNSSLFYIYFIAYGDCFHLSDWLVTSFPLSPSIFEDETLFLLNVKLMDDLKKYANRKTINTSAEDLIAYDEFNVFGSKAILDEIDTRVARHYDFMEHELDVILNYDIKFRLGDTSEAEVDV
jgi:hypothetical protein